jgi:hypothetical protein
MRHAPMRELRFSSSRHDGPQGGVNPQKVKRMLIHVLHPKCRNQRFGKAIEAMRIANDIRPRQAAEAHLAEPVEVSDPFRAPPISLSPWLICLRSGKSEESKRLTYSAFFTDKYVSSHYSAIVDKCGEQAYHSLKDN